MSTLSKQLKTEIQDEFNISYCETKNIIELLCYEDIISPNTHNLLLSKLKNMEAQFLNLEKI